MNKIEQLVKQMTVEEKAKMLAGADFWHLKGVERLGIEQVMVADGPHGLRKQDTSGDHVGLLASVEAVCFPAACATACSFDTGLIKEMGGLLGDECQAEDVSVILGPGANIKRSPLCGRNFEYFSEDPYLTGEMAAAFIQGVQEKNIGTSLKHFALNNQEHRRMNTSANVDERTMHEIYLKGFEKAVKQSQPWTVMCSYNRINGIYASENPLTLRKLLKEDWGFEGYTVTDWGACNDHVKGVEAGLDLEMPYGGAENDEKLIAAIHNGDIKMDVIDEAVTRILTVVYRYLDNHNPDASYDKSQHAALSRKIACECIVLLKNDDGILPLSTKQQIGFIGQYAEAPRYQGNGSSQINPSSILSALEAAKGVAEIAYAKGFDDESDDNAQQLLEEAVELAKTCDVAVVFAGLPSAFESEGFDRAHMRMPCTQNKLIEAVAKANPNTIVVLHNGAPVEMPWLNSVKGLIEVYLGGQAVGGATVDVLFGEVNPSGKLAETFPVKLTDNPSYLNFPGDGDNVDYREGLYVGYRYYDKKDMQVLFPFGFGLSYSTFAYSNLRISSATLTDGAELQVSVDVTNSGSREGKEIVQLYVSSRHEGISRPIRELKGFNKVSLLPGETKTVSFQLDCSDFAYYETVLHDWYAENGEYAVEIGSSSRDIRLSTTVEVTGSKPVPHTFTINSTIGDVKKVSNDVVAVENLLDEINKVFGIRQTQRPEKAQKTFERMIDAMPLRSIISFARGKVTEAMVNDLIDKLNADMK